jgi:alpha/beta superfamily hydrolase
VLALAAAARGANLQDMVLWGPAVNGRAILRELRAFQKLELQEYANGDPSPAQPIPGLEVAGFLISDETQHALESLDLSRLPNLRGKRIMVLSRDDIAPDYGLVRALESSGCTLEVKPGRGYTAMMAPPHDAVPPAETWASVVDFLTRVPRENFSTTLRIDQSAIPITENDAIRGTETFWTTSGPSGSIFGILSEPASNTAGDFCLLFLNPGASRHIGPNRMWVEAARRWAARGVRSFRMDFEGIGESEGELDANLASLYQGHSVEQVELAIDYLRSRVGARQFAVIGLCSGAFWGFHAAIRNPAIRGGILLNPRLFFWDPEVDRRRMLRHAVNGLTDSTAWSRLARGKIDPQRIKQTVRIMIDRFRGHRAERRRDHQIPPEAMARAWAALEKNDCHLNLVFTEGEPLLLEMEEEGQFPPQHNPRIGCIRIANGGHTFRPLWAQKVIHEVIDDGVDTILRASIAEPRKSSTATFA